MAPYRAIRIWLVALSSGLAYLGREEGLGYHGPSGRKFSNRPNYDRLRSVVLALSLGLTLTLGFPLSLFGI